MRIELRKNKLPKGVYFDNRRKKNPFTVIVCLDYKNYSGGSYPSVEDAQIAYLNLYDKLHNEVSQSVNTVL